MHKQKRLFLERIDNNLHYLNVLWGRAEKKDDLDASTRFLRRVTRLKVLRDHANKTEYKPFKVKIVK